MESFKSFIAETSLSRIHQHLQNRNIGIISAMRSDRSAEENNKHQQELQKSLKDSGFGHIPVHGGYIENLGKPGETHVHEKSFIVVGDKGNDKGRLKNFLKAHGEKHNQDSIIHKAHNENEIKLHGLKDNVYPGKNTEHDLGTFHPNKLAEYYTQLRSSSKNSRHVFKLGQESENKKDDEKV